MQEKSVSPRIAAWHTPYTIHLTPYTLHHTYTIHSTSSHLCLLLTTDNFLLEVCRIMNIFQLCDCAAAVCWPRRRHSLQMFDINNKSRDVIMLSASAATLDLVSCPVWTQHGTRVHSTWQTVQYLQYEESHLSACVCIEVLTRGVWLSPGCWCCAGPGVGKICSLFSPLVPTTGRWNFYQIC